MQTAAMNRPHILVAEDDAPIRSGLVDTLESEGYRVTPAADGVQALTLFKRGAFDLVLLDIMMPGQSGYDVCRALRAERHPVPIIMLTAKSEEIDKVVGLELGADDYIAKPFGVRELLARIAAVLRRARPAPPAPDPAAATPERFAFGAAEVDARQYRVRRGPKQYDLSARELQLLLHFRAHPDAALTRDELLNAAWGIHYQGTTRTLDQHIAQLRKKIEAQPDAPQTILTVHGIGYRYVPTPPAAAGKAASSHSGGRRPSAGMKRPR